MVAWLRQQSATSAKLEDTQAAADPAAAENPGALVGMQIHSTTPPKPLTDRAMGARGQPPKSRRLPVGWPTTRSRLIKSSWAPRARTAISLRRRCSIPIENPSWRLSCRGSRGRAMVGRVLAVRAMFHVGEKHFDLACGRPVGDSSHWPPRGAGTVPRRAACRDCHRPKCRERHWPFSTKRYRSTRPDKFTATWPPYRTSKPWAIPWIPWNACRISMPSFNSRFDKTMGFCAALATTATSNGTTFTAFA